MIKKRLTALTNRDLSAGIQSPKTSILGDSVPIAL